MDVQYDDDDVGGFEWGYGGDGVIMLIDADGV